LNQRLRSRLLAASIMSTTLLGFGGFVYPQRSALAQDRQPAAAQLDRGAALYDQKNFADARRILADIDPAQLPEELRARRADLLARTDAELQKVLASNQRAAEAKADYDAGRFAAAAAKYQAVIDDSATPADVKQAAQIQLALVKTAMPAETVAAASAAPAATAPMPNPMDLAPLPGAPAPAAGAATAPANLLQTAKGELDILRERTLTLYYQSKQMAKDALDKGQYQAAAAQAQQAIDLINQHPAYFSDLESSSLRDAGQALLDLVNDRWRQYQFDQRTKALEIAKGDEAQRIKNAKQIRQEKVAALVADSRKLYDATQFKEAADLLRQATIIDPEDQNAALMLRLVMTKITDRDYEAIQHRAGQEIMRQQIDNVEHLIPYADLMIYPDNWPEITRKRVGGETSSETPQNRVVRNRLEENLKEITADAQGLEKVLNFLRDNMGANIFVNWTALQAVQVDRNTPVSLSLKEVSFRKALTTILSQAGGTEASLGYTIDDGIITISTKEDLQSSKYQLVKVFDIRDMLVVQDPNIQAPKMSLNSSGGGGGGYGGGGGGVGGGGGGFGGGGGGGFGGGGGGGFGGGGGGGGGGLFSDTSRNTSSTGGTEAQRQQAVNSLIDTIKSTVASDTWKDSGGTIGSIRELNGQLIINQTVDNQIAIYNLLQQLRETRSVQIAIEARLLLVANNFLDDFRVGWNIDMPAGLIGGSVGAVSLGNMNTYNQAIPGNTGIPGSISSFSTLPSLNLAASIIDNWTLNLLITATQADRRTITVTAPRVTIFNGQTGYIAVQNQQNYVSSFNQTTASGGISGSSSTGTNLQINTLSTGVVLGVTATVSADRRYVVMTLEPQLTTLEGLDTFTTSNSAGNSTANNSGNNNSTTTGLGGAFVQLPKIAVTDVNTMVSIPDGGTLLIGGQKLIGESEVEVGVPILSKIPGLNRLFTNRSYVKDERTLLVLVRPNIVIHREIENDLFGVGYDRPTGLPGNTGASGNGSSMSVPNPAAP
jgi:Flp pilus assembly secretin CpaC